MGPDYHPPQAQTPGAFGELAATGATPSVTVGTPAELSTWWTTFADPTLDGLIGRAIAANLDLRRARAAVLQARAQRGVTGRGFWPTVDVSTSYERFRNSPNAASVNSSGSAGNGTSRSFSGTDQSLYQAGFDASWEIDVFGGIRRGIEAADANLGAAVEDERDVLVMILGEVALNYVQLRGAQRQIAIARANLAAQTDTLDIVRTRFDAGLVPDLDVAQAQAQVATTDAQIPTLEATARQAIHQLGVLVAQEPMALSAELTPEAPIPAPPREVPVGLPSDLLRRRPDIRGAERRLAASTARIGVAVADLYPRFSLTGAYGLESLSLGSLGDASSRFWSIGPSVRWNIFDAGAIRWNIRVQEAAQEQVLVTYQQTVLTALQEVEDALVTFVKLQSRRELLQKAVDANRRAVSLANDLYAQGRADFTTVLTAQLALYSTEDALAQSDRDVSLQLVALYKALGGGWNPDAAPDGEQASAMSGVSPDHSKEAPQ